MIRRKFRAYWINIVALYREQSHCLRASSSSTDCNSSRMPFNVIWGDFSKHAMRYYPIINTLHVRIVNCMWRLFMRLV